jgi:signal transduction histidine kinase
VEIRSGNELELLGKFFNQMMDQIRVNQNDLENIIEQRTKEYILAKREAEEANLQKSKFLANVSHEIRTQMNSLLGILNLIDMGTFDLSFEVEKRLSELKNILRIKAMQKTDDSDSQMILERIESLFKVIDNDKSVKKIFYGHLEEDVLSICTDPSESETVSNIFAEIQSAIDKENTDYHQSIRRARDSGNYLLSIVNRILNLAKVESGRVDIHPEEIDFNSFFSDLQFTIANYVTSKEKNGKIEIIYDIQLNHYKTIISDKNIIKEVLLNLVSNSVKYTEKGSVIIRVVSDAQSLRFYIIDTGIGIKDEDKKSIFTAYSRGFNVVNVEGTGLGLILSKYLIESIGGSIGFDSQYLLGSTFWFSIPIN